MAICDRTVRFAKETLLRGTLDLGYFKNYILIDYCTDVIDKVLASETHHNTFVLFTSQISDVQQLNLICLSLNILFKDIFVYLAYLRSLFFQIVDYLKHLALIWLFVNIVNLGV